MSDWLDIKNELVNKWGQLTSDERWDAIRQNHKEWKAHRSNYEMGPNDVADLLDFIEKMKSPVSLMNQSSELESKLAQVTADWEADHKISMRNLELYERAAAENTRYRVALENLLGAIEFSGWSIDDEQWKKPIRVAKAIVIPSPGECDCNTKPHQPGHTHVLGVYCLYCDFKNPQLPPVGPAHRTASSEGGKEGV